MVNSKPMFKPNPLMFPPEGVMSSVEEATKMTRE